MQCDLSIKESSSERFPELSSKTGLVYIWWTERQGWRQCFKGEERANLQEEETGKGRLQEWGQVPEDSAGWAGDGIQGLGSPEGEGVIVEWDAILGERQDGKGMRLQRTLSRLLVEITVVSVGGA